MKAKLILTAMAMPVLFAACSSDELVPMEQTQQQVQRPLLSKDFKLVSKIEGNDTRYAVNGNTGLTFSWTEGDQFGAATVDLVIPNAPAKDWAIIKSLGGQNTPFDYNVNDGSWSAPSNMEGIGEGHYIFTFPYNPKDNSRKAIAYKLPTVQKMQNAKGEFDLNGAIFYDKENKVGNKAIAAELCDGTDNVVEVTLRNLYSYPKFHILFDNGQAVTTVQKIALRRKAKFAVAGALNHKKVVDLFADAKKASDEEAYWKNIQTDEFLITKKEAEATASTANYTNAIPEPFGGFVDYEESEYIIAEFPGAGAAVQPSGDATSNRCIDARIMIPGALADAYTYNTGDADKTEILDLYIYTNNGIYKVNDVVNNAEYKSTTTEAQKERIFARNASNTVTVRVGAANKTTDIYLVSNENEWNALVGRYDKTGADIDVAIVGENFTLTENAAIPEKGTFSFVSNLIVTGVHTEAIDNINVVGSLIVKAGAVVTIGKNFSATDIKVEGGAVTRAAAGPGTLSVGKESANGLTIETSGNVVVSADAVAAFSVTVNEGGYFENNGKSTVTLVNNSGNVVNNGTLIIDGASSNNTANGSETIGQMTNSEDANLYAYSMFTNNADFFNKGMVINFVNGTGTFYPYPGASTHLTTADGDFDLTNDFTAEFAGTAPTAFKYTINAGDSKSIEQLNNKGVTKLTINGGILAGTNEAGDGTYSKYEGTVTITENGGSLNGVAGNSNELALAIDVHKSLTVSNFKLNNVNVKCGILTIAGDTEAEFVTLGSNTVENGKQSGTIIVNKGKVFKFEDLSIADNLGKAYGIIQNNGTMTAKDYSNGTADKDNLDETKFTWSGNGHDNLDGDPSLVTKYKDMTDTYMKGAVESWADRWGSNWINNNYNQYYSGNPYDFAKFEASVKYGATATTSVWGDWLTLLTLGETSAVTYVNSETSSILGDAQKTNVEAYGADLFKKENGVYVTEWTGDFEDAVDAFFEKELDNDPDVEDNYAKRAKSKLYTGAVGSEKYNFVEAGSSLKLYNTEADAEDAFLTTIGSKNFWQYWVAGADGTTANSAENKEAAILSAYVWYELANKTTDSKTAFDLYMVAYPYKYIWVGCQLDEVVDAIGSAEWARWRDLFGLDDNKATEKFGNASEAFTTIKQIQNWMKYAGNISASTGNGKVAYDIYQKYGQAVKAWTYKEGQISACKDETFGK